MIKSGINPWWNAYRVVGLLSRARTDSRNAIQKELQNMSDYNGQANIDGANGMTQFEQVWTMKLRIAVNWLWMLFDCLRSNMLIIEPHCMYTSKSWRVRCSCMCRPLKLTAWRPRAQSPPSSAHYHRFASFNMADVVDCHSEAHACLNRQASHRIASWRSASLLYGKPELFRIVYLCSDGRTTNSTRI